MSDEAIAILITAAVVAGLVLWVPLLHAIQREKATRVRNLRRAPSLVRKHGASTNR